MSLVDNSSFGRFALTAFNINQTRNSDLLKKYEKNYDLRVFSNTFFRNEQVENKISLNYVLLLLLRPP